MFYHDNLQLNFCALINNRRHVSFLDYIYRWSKIASFLCGRTDNEIKNIWNTHLKKRFAPEECRRARRKPKLVPNNPSQSASCRDGCDTSIDKSNNLECEQVSSDEKTKIVIDLDESLSPEDLILAANDAPFSPQFASCSNSSTYTAATDEFNLDCNIQDSAIFMDVMDQSLAPAEMELLSANSYHNSSSNASYHHAPIAAIEEPITAPSGSCNFEEEKILIELDECLASGDLELSLNDYHIISSNTPLNSEEHMSSLPSVSCNNPTTADSTFNGDCKQDAFLIEPEKCKDSTDFDLGGLNYDCHIPSTCTQMNLDLVADVPEVPMKLPEIWNIVDDDSYSLDNAEESFWAKTLEEIDSNARGVEDKGLLAYLEKELELY